MNEKKIQHIKLRQKAAKKVQRGKFIAINAYIRNEERVKVIT